MPDEPVLRWETFPSLVSADCVVHAFTKRSAGLDSRSDRARDQFLAALGFDPQRFVGAEQTHGDGVAIIDHPSPTGVPGVDALVTDKPGLPLVIRSADCVPVYLVDPDRPAIGLVHSGRAGTGLNLVGRTLAAMERAYGTQAARCHATLGPSIGPCHYETDLWQAIEDQLAALGVREVHNPRVCTACHLEDYYSYRAERGQTGRMLALLALKAT